MYRLSRNPGALNSRTPQGHVGLFRGYYNLLFRYIQWGLYTNYCCLGELLLCLYYYYLLIHLCRIFTITYLKHTMFLEIIIIIIIVNVLLTTVYHLPCFRYHSHTLRLHPIFIYQNPCLLNRSQTNVFGRLQPLMSAVMCFHSLSLTQWVAGCYRTIWAVGLLGNPFHSLDWQMEGAARDGPILIL
jgi:hypothetical protein